MPVGNTFADELRRRLQGPQVGGARPSGGTGGYPDYGGDRGYFEDRSPIPVPSPGLGGGGYQFVPGQPSLASGPGFGVIGNPNGAPQPGLGMGTPSPVMYEDYSMGYPGVASPNPLVHPEGVGDPLLILLQMLLGQRFPNGM